MGVTWYSELYTGKRFREDLAATAAQISQGTYTGSAFVITIAVNGKDQLVNCDGLASSVLHPVRNFQFVLPFFRHAEPG